MLDAVKYGLANLANFKGRDARQTFWYYVLFVYILNVLITMAVSVPMSISMVTSAISRAAQNPNNEAAAMGAINGMTNTLMWVSMAAGALMLILLAASFVRRLHDSGLSGYWALIPGALQLAALAMMPVSIRRLTESMADLGGGVDALQMQTGAASVMGWLPILIVILLGIRKSTPGPNRFGKASVSF
jgi:uncharacterized membrane protein YhaH (DUF805 family)